MSEGVLFIRHQSLYTPLCKWYCCCSHCTACVVRISLRHRFASGTAAAHTALTIWCTLQAGRAAFNPMLEFSEFTRKEIADYTATFKQYDADKNNSLNVEELKKLMEKMGHPQTHTALIAMIREVDEDRDGEISMREVRAELVQCSFSAVLCVSSARFNSTHAVCSDSCYAALRSARFIVLTQCAASSLHRAESGFSYTCFIVLTAVSRVSCVSTDCCLTV
jgi:EF-hand domain pair